MARLLPLLSSCQFLSALMSWVISLSLLLLWVCITVSSSDSDSVVSYSLSDCFSFSYSKSLSSLNYSVHVAWSLGVSLIGSLFVSSSGSFGSVVMTLSSFSRIAWNDSDIVWLAFAAFVLRGTSSFFFPSIVSYCFFSHQLRLNGLCTS